MRRYHLFLILHIPLPFLKPANNYITHNATQLLSDITGGNVLDYIQLPLKTQNAVFYYSLPPTYAGVLIKIICKKCWSYPLSCPVLGLKSE